MENQLIVTGVYGHLHTLREIVRQWNPETEDLVFVGNIIDYGYNSYGVLKEVMQLKHKYPEKVFLLLGSHELALEEFLKNPSIKAEDYFRTGGISTITSFASDGVPTECFADVYYLTEEVLPSIDFTLFDEYVFYSQDFYESKHLTIISKNSKQLEALMTKRKQLDYPKPFIYYSTPDCESILQSNYLSDYMNKPFFDKRTNAEKPHYSTSEQSDFKGLIFIETEFTSPQTEIVRVEKDTVVLKQQITLEN